MYKLRNLLFVLFLSSCYFDKQTGCTQHFNYIDCPRPHLYKVGATEIEKNIDMDRCLQDSHNTREIYQCMENKGYKRIYQ